jgi:HPt (histidine-containing phosphotransfer) domain-containing protein
VQQPVRSTPAPQAEVQGSTGLEEDEEMREIFIDEAREVIQGADEALQRLDDTPDDLGDLTLIRRAFHTLKGSSRMVGLKVFGEAAWSCEQLYNVRLAETSRLERRPGCLHRRRAARTGPVGRGHCHRRATAGRCVADGPRRSAAPASAEARPRPPRRCRLPPPPARCSSACPNCPVLGAAARLRPAERAERAGRAAGDALGRARSAARPGRAGRNADRGAERDARAAVAGPAGRSLG